MSQIDEKPLDELMLKEKIDNNEKQSPSFQTTITSKDKILDNFYDQIGYSRYHVLQIFMVCLLNVSIGSQSIFLNVIELQLIKEWSLEVYQTAMLVSCFSFGIAIGINFFKKCFFRGN